MANYTGKGGNKFKPGQSGNPGGRPKTPSYLKDVTPLTRDEIKRLFSKYARMTKKELKKVSEDTNTQAIDLIIVRGLLISLAVGDYKRLDFILTRAIEESPSNVSELSHSSIIEYIESEESKHAAV